MVVGGSVVVVGTVVVVVEVVVVVVEVVGGAELTTGTRADCDELLHAATARSAPMTRQIRRATPPGYETPGRLRRTG